MAKENEELFQQDISMFEEAAEFIEERNKEFNEENPPTGEEKDELENKEDLTNEETENKEDLSSQKAKESSPLAPYAKLLVEEGVFQSSDIEKWDGTAEGFVSLEMSKLEEWKEDYKTNTLHPRLKWLQDNLEDGVPLKTLLDLDEKSTTLESITPELLEDNGEIQKNVARAYFKRTTSFSDIKIEKEIKKLEDADELRDESKEFFEELKGLDKKDKEQFALDAKKQREDAIKAQNETLKTFKTTLEKTEEVVTGLKVNQIMRDKIYKSLTTVVEVDETSGTPLNKIAKARMQDPINFEIKLAYLFEVTDGFKNWDIFTTKGKKDAYNNFEAAARELDKGKHSARTMSSPAVDEFFAAYEKEIKK